MKQGPNTQQRLLRALARKAAAILSRYEAGEFAGVRAAAREAGITKDDPPFKQAEKLIKKFLPKLSATRLTGCRGSSTGKERSQIC